MNCVTYCIDRVKKYGIPNYILELAFPDDTRFPGIIETLDYKINYRCVRYIIKDMNMLGGVVQYINLSDCEIIHKDDMGQTMVIKVPEELTNYQPIINAYHAQVTGYPGVMPYAVGTPLYGGVTPGLIDANKIANTVSYGSNIQTARLYVLKDHIIQIDGMLPYHSNVSIKIERANNSNLENIPNNMYNTVYKIVLTGIKAFVYNNLHIAVSQGTLYGGHDISAVSDTISGYSDAHDMYMELLDEWRQDSFLADPTQVNDYIKTIIGMSV